MAREAGGSPREWLAVDETAAAFLSRSLAARPPILLPPPLHRAPLRPGNVVEIAGPSNSGKSQLLLMAAVQCILPKEWEGVYFGGLGKEVMYIDLDCRFDVLRLAQILRNRIAEGCGSAHPINEQFVKDGTEDILFTDCMKRFFYVRCYSSSELIVVLKTVYSQSEARRALGVGIYFLMLDSIGAFYWIDRCSQPTRDSKGKTQSLQSITESVVQEIRKFLQLQPVLVLVSKAHIYGEGITTSNDFQSLICLETEEPLFFDGDQLNVQSLASIKEEAHVWPFSSVANGRWLIIACVVDSTHDWQGTSKFLTEDSTVLRYSKWEEEINTSCREYMPSVWQTFVTHRIKLQDLVQESGISSEQESEVLSIHTSEWVRPSLNIKEKFYIRDEVYRLCNQRLERSDGDWRTTRRYAADALEICQVLTRHMPETKVFVIPTEHNKA